MPLNPLGGDYHITQTVESQLAGIILCMALSSGTSMTKLLLVLLVVGSHLVLVSCATKGVALSPLTEQERQRLGTIGIMAEPSGTEISYSRPPFIADSALREMLAHLHDSRQGDREADKPAKTLKEFEGFRCSNQECLLGVPLYLLAAQIVKRGAGGGAGAIVRKIYSNSLLMGFMEKSAIRAVQESIDTGGLSGRLRDEVWTVVQRHPAYRFELGKGLPDETPDMSGKSEGAQYHLLHDKGIATLLKIKIPLVEFRGSEPDGPYQLFVHVETTLLHTADGSLIRRNTLAYRGGSLQVAEWDRDDARLLVDGLHQGFRLIAQRVVRELFEYPSPFSLRVSRAVSKNLNLSPVLRSKTTFVPNSINQLV